MRFVTTVTVIGCLVYLNTKSTGWPNEESPPRSSLLPSLPGQLSCCVLSESLKTAGVQRGFGQMHLPCLLSGAMLGMPRMVTMMEEMQPEERHR